MKHAGADGGAGTPGSTRVVEVPDPVPTAGELLVEGLAIGVCGTDREIEQGEYGVAPRGRARMVLGHEALGRVAITPEDSEFVPGDLVVGIVRRPDPEPCGACARGEWDMCRNGRYRERGIRELDGYASQLWTVPAHYAVKVDKSLGISRVLTEPTSIVAKAWEQIERVGGRSWFDPRRVLITGAGPIGLLAALLGIQRGLEVHVLDRVTEGPKPDLVRDLGASYHHDGVQATTRRTRPDVVVEATGVGSVVFGAIAGTPPYGVVCLTGVSPAGRRLSFDAGALNREVVLENDAVVGSVNANYRHYRSAAAALAGADRDWLRRLITRVLPLERYHEAFPHLHPVLRLPRTRCCALAVAAGGVPAVGRPRVTGTVQHVQRELSRDGLLLRYDPEADGGTDGLPGAEGAFTACSFWLVDALQGTGRATDAERLFERLPMLRNDVGMLSEEYDVANQRHLGNTPQSFSLEGLVNSARHLEGARTRTSESGGREDMQVWER